MIQLLKSILNKLGWSKQKDTTAPTEAGYPKAVKSASPAANEDAVSSSDENSEDPAKTKRRRRSSGKSTPVDRTPPKPQAPPWDPNAFEVPPTEGLVRFHDLDLPEPVMHAVCDLGFQYCTPIQAEIMPSTLAGKDASGRAQTGTGKTAAFLITSLTHLLRNPVTEKRRKGEPQVLVLAPTRELVMQIAEEGRNLAKYTNVNIVTVFGGMDYEKQRRQLSHSNIDIVVATPGRLLDFKRQGDVRLDNVKIMIIDEADRMLDMGFIPDVRKIILSTPHKTKRQTLLFSATLTPEVTRLSAQWTTDPITVEIEPKQVAVDTVEQIVYIVTREDKYVLLYNIITRNNLERVIVFCNRKDETRKLADLFTRYQIDCAVLSGDIRQRTRIRTLDDFKAGKIRVLVATDVAGRGIHIEGMDHVINYTLPRDPEDYVHRIGRTGRAGSAGTSISFADEEDSFYIPKIEAFIGNNLPCTQPEDEWLTPPPPPPESKRKPRNRQSRPQGKSAGAPRRSRSRSNNSRPRRRPAKPTGDSPKSGKAARKRPQSSRPRRPAKERSGSEGPKSES